MRRIAKPRWISLLTGMVALVCSVAAVADQEAPDMQAWMAAATPGPHHQSLVARDGEWKTTTRMWMVPGQEPTVTQGTATIEAVLGGRFIEEVAQAPMMGQAWEGRGVYGFDNVAQKHIGTWYDSFGTMIMNFEGTCEEHCKKVSMTSRFFDPASKTTKTMKSVTNQISADEAMVTLYDVVDGKDVKSMEIHYERIPSQAKR